MGGELLVRESQWTAGNLGTALLDSCSYGVDVRNRAFHFNPFLPRATAPCRGDRRIGPDLMADTPARTLLKGLGIRIAGRTAAAR